jgi:polyhydroxyalkanoate synthesis regulator phasin
MINSPPTFATCDDLKEIQMKVDTMEMPKPAPVADFPQQVSGGLQYARSSGRKVMLAYVGFWAIVYDNVADLYQGGVKLISTAEQRGVRVGQDLSKRLQNMEQKATGEIKKVQTQIGESVEQTRSGVLETRHGVADELEKRVELVLANLGVPSRERLERLSREIEELNYKLDQELLRSEAHDW